MANIHMNIEKLRKERDMSQSALAKHLGISRSAVNAWEMGLSKPHIDHVVKMVEIFRVTADCLLDINNAKYSLDISDLPDNERKILIDLAVALRSRK
ncbi:MAG: helix-turn-helix domain-containing protein [Defluviitaleaceae bacterium]|nr:helix-turn-helix domain-containing protein [Defluviitaleaceae bacterium]